MYNKINIINTIHIYVHTKQFVQVFESDWLRDFYSTNAIFY